MPIVGQKHDQANVQICTILDIHLLRQIYTTEALTSHDKVVQICTLGIGCINLHTLGRERGVQICTHATFHSDKSEKQTTPRH